jgi:hypothetical protein
LSSNYCFDNASVKTTGKGKIDKDKEDRDGKEKASDEPVKSSFAQMEGKCYCCGNGGHMSNNQNQNG